MDALNDQPAPGSEVSDPGSQGAAPADPAPVVAPTPGAPACEATPVGRRFRIGRRTVQRFLAAFTFGILGVLAVSAGALAAFESSNTGRVMPGVHVGSVDLSGLTPSEARARLNAEINKARSSGVVVLKIIHGHGASGVGGKLRNALRRSLQRRRKEKKIRSFVTGEKWAVVEEATRELLEECPELRNDADLNGYNEGITFVLL